MHSENRVFLKLGRHIGRGLKKMILVGIFQYFFENRGTISYAMNECAMAWFHSVNTPCKNVAEDSSISPLTSGHTLLPQLV